MKKQTIETLSKLFDFGYKWILIWCILVLFCLYIGRYETVAPYHMTRKELAKYTVKVQEQQPWWCTVIVRNR